MTAKNIAIVTTAVASVITAAVAMNFYWQDRGDRLVADLSAERQQAVEKCEDDVRINGRESVQAQFSCGMVREITLRQMGIDTSGMSIEQINRQYGHIHP